MSIPIAPDATPRDIALTFLDLAAQTVDLGRMQSIYYARLAREQGVTNREIGERLGVTEGAVRAMLKRAGGQNAGK